MTATLRQVKDLVSEAKPFKGNSIYAERAGDLYVVYSYGPHFPIAVLRDGVWHVNTGRYSQTTSRHQSATRLGIHYNGNPSVDADTDALKRLIAEAESTV